MFARRLIINDVGARVVPPAAAPPALPVADAVPAPSLDLRETLRAALAIMAGAAEVAARARVAQAWAQGDVARARAALERYVDIDVKVAAHLATLARSATARTGLPAELQELRRGAFEAGVTLQDAVNTLALLDAEAASTQTELDGAGIAADNLVNVLTAREATGLIDQLRDLERRAGRLRVLAAAVGVPRDSLQPCTLRKDEALWIEAVGSDGTEAFEGLVNFVPEVIAGERDMAPGQRGDLGEELVGNVDALSLGARQRSRPACDRSTDATNPQTPVVAHWVDPTGFVAQKSSHLASYFSDSADDHGNQLFAVTQNALTLNVRGCRESLATPGCPRRAEQGRSSG